MIDDTCVRVLPESLMLGNGCIVLDEDLGEVCCQNVSHPAENMPAIWYGLIPMGYARYVSLVSVQS